MAKISYFKHTFSSSRRAAPESCLDFGAPKIKGHRECRALAAPVASHAKIKSTRVSHHGHTGFTRHSRRNGFNGFLRALPGEPGFFATITREIIILQA